MPRLRTLLPVLLLGLLMLPAPAAGEESAAAGAAEILPAVIRRYAADEDSLRAFYDQPLSELRLERMTRFLEAWEAELGAVDPADLGAADTVDFLLLRNHLLRRRDEIALQRARNAEVLPFLGFAPELLELDRARWRPAEAPDGRRLADALVGVRERLAEGRALAAKRHAAKEDDGPALDPVIAFRAAQTLDRLTRLLADWHAFHDGFDPTFAWWVDKPYEALRADLGSYATWLRREVAGAKPDGPEPLIGDPIGDAALRRALDREFIDQTPEQLLEIAEAQFAWCEARGREAAKALGVADWAAVVEKVKGLHAEPGRQAALVVGQALEATRFVTERDLVTVPPLAAETWRLRMLGLKAQKTLPFAVYNNQHMLVAYALGDMPHDAKLMSMRGNNEHFTRIVTPHELIPGHHLQLFQAARHRSYRALFRTPFLVEGWALHWEMLLWDLGWARSPADRVGMLFWRMHRCARIIVTLRFHLGQMKPAAMIDFLVDRVGLERDGATAEVRRYIGGAYGPLYQCAYMLGGLQMRALHHELVGGGRMSNRAFHDAVLRQNSIPIKLIRTALSGASPAEPWDWARDAMGGERPR